MKPVIVYTTLFCPYCTAAKSLLTKKGVPFEEIDATGNSDLRQEIMERSGQHTVPQIFIGEQSVGGFSELNELDMCGELDELLAD
ncbi:MAG: glutaredoxin 3 [Desulfurellaceae bacterium]|nr:glutaredoxin 3 [Desulfurellaceae bacterium]